MHVMFESLFTHCLLSFVNSCCALCAMNTVNENNVLKKNLISHFYNQPLSELSSDRGNVKSNLFCILTQNFVIFLYCFNTLDGSVFNLWDRN